MATKVYLIETTPHHLNCKLYNRYHHKSHLLKCDTVKNNDYKTFVFSSKYIYKSSLYFNYEILCFMINL